MAKLSRKIPLWQQLKNDKQAVKDARNVVKNAEISLTVAKQRFAATQSELVRIYGAEFKISKHERKQYFSMSP